MRYLTSFILSLLAIPSCYANAPVALTNGTANYKQTLMWSKEKIIQEAKPDSTDQEIRDALGHFPIVQNDQCGNLKLIFIQNTPQCGAINCKYLVFSVSTSSNYRYLNEIDFSAKRLFCYPESNYFVTSEHETNATSLLTLYQVKNDMKKKAELEVDYTDAIQAKFADGLWDKGFSEAELLKGFKIK